MVFKCDYWAKSCTSVILRLEVSPDGTHEHNQPNSGGGNNRRFWGRKLLNQYCRRCASVLWQRTKWLQSEIATFACQNAMCVFSTSRVKNVCIDLEIKENLYLKLASVSQWCILNRAIDQSATPHTYTMFGIDLISNGHSHTYLVACVSG